LFPAPRSDGHLTSDWVQKLCRQSVRRAELTKAATPHTLRHSYATHLVEAGVDLLTLQKILGHTSLNTTTLYVHLSTKHLQQTPSLLDLLSDWVVYAKPPFGGPEQVLKYLARYTHRVAISNARLLSLDDGRVTFRYKDYAEDQQHKTMTLTTVEFLRRFVQHVQPPLPRTERNSDQKKLAERGRPSV
jgi:hypothetical protein